MTENSSSQTAAGEKPMMKCGHAANSFVSRRDGVEIDPPVPACVICAGIDPGAYDIDDSPPSLDGRLAKCSYRLMRNGKSHPEALTVPSKSGLAFFEHLPAQPFDSYYCGCWGWD